MKLFARLFVVFAVFTGLSCSSGPSGNGNVETAKTVENIVASAPTKGVLVDLETKAFEAWKTRNLAFWDAYLDDKFVSFTNGKRLDKAGEIKMLSEMKCEIFGYTFADEKMVPVGNDAIILTTKASVDGTCDGRKIPSPLTSATLYVRSGSTWKAAYHNEVPIIDLKSLKSGQKRPEISGTKPEETDAFTSSFLSVERRSWEAMRSKNRSQMEALLTDDVTLVDQIGKVTIGKNALTAALTDPKCSIVSGEPAGAIASDISPVIAILNYKALVTGTCETQPFSNFWGTTIFHKEGREWKTAYQFRTPI